MTTIKQSIAFPEVAVIRKGKPKNARGQVGQDLQNKFRVVFYPGVDPAIIETFTKAYKSHVPERIRAFVPFPTVWDAFSSFNEAHNAGRMVAQADEERYLMLKDPLTGQYQVRNGEPFKAYTPGDKITYERNGKTFELPLKTTNRLRLVIPEIVATGRLVTFTFKSTALYDRFNLEQQLGAIQALANTLNRGNAAGIPFWLYRAEREITWNKKDGSAARIKKWLVHLEPDPDWVKAAFERMSKFALTGSTAFALPATLPDPLEMEAEPEEEADDDENVIETEAHDVPASPTKNGRTRATAAPGSPLAEFDRLGELLWPGDKWAEVRKAILYNQDPASLDPKELKKALGFVQKREQEIADLDGLLKHIEKAWPVALSFLPLAYAEIEQATGKQPDPMSLIAATSAAIEDKNFYENQDPQVGAAIILSNFPEPPLDLGEPA